MRPALVVPKSKSYEVVEKTVKILLAKLQTINLFDVFESEKLGADKIDGRFTFLDEENINRRKIDGMMKKIMNAFEKELQAEMGNMIVDLDWHLDFLLFPILICRGRESEIEI